ncbi:MAG: hypothetical protein IIU08_07755 [Clostridia bacterium]|nr:hypothetical protein [Clostridia bacterium]MBQ3956918.1 hypothetical protein [Clostridia bacterium]MBQ5355748.1 hypothetical protein [Clostridia bacterium]
MTWKEFRIEREGRRGWEIVLPCFSDEERPEDAERMNRFYGTAAERMAEAAKLETAADARRARYRCETRIDVLTEEDARSGEEGSPGNGSPGEKRKGLFFRRRGTGKSGSDEERGRAGDIRVTLDLELAVSGRRTRRKTLEQLWRDGTLCSSRVLL